jgi:hypothetical protein
MEERHGEDEERERKEKESSQRTSMIQQDIYAIRDGSDDVYTVERT